jgi:hypothetical protein
MRSSSSRFRKRTRASIQAASVPQNPVPFSVASASISSILSRHPLGARLTLPLWGPAGPAAVTLWAVVDSTGKLLRASNAISASIFPTGYEVDFDRDVSQCSYQATLGSGQAEAGEVGVGPRNGVPNGVFVLTTDGSGNPQPHGFNLAVYC